MTPITSIAAYLLYLTLSLPNSQFCTDVHRNALNPKSTLPVCALYTGDCSDSVTGICQKNFSNAHAACQDSNVLVFTTGECSQVSVQPCSTSSKASSDDKVCSFSVQRRLGGVSQDIVKASISASDACKSDNTAFYVKSDCFAVGNAGNNICTKDMRAQASKCTPTPTTVTMNCVYYTGGDCEGQLCRETRNTDCSLCMDSSVVFFTEGGCDSNIIEDLMVSDGLLQRDPNGWDLSNDDVATTEAEVLEDGTIMLTPVESKTSKPDVNVNPNDPNGLDLSNDTPAVEAEVLEDGTTLLTPVDSNTSEPEAPVDDPNGLDLSNDVPEVEAEELEDGTIMLTPVESSTAQADVDPNDPNGLDLSNDDVATTEAEVLEDGTTLLTPIESTVSEPEVNVDPNDPNGLDLSNDDPATEAEVLEDGTTMLTPVESSTSEPEVNSDPNDPNGWDLSNDDVATTVAEVLEDGTTLLTPVESQSTEPTTTSTSTDNTGKDSDFEFTLLPMGVFTNGANVINVRIALADGQSITVADYQEPDNTN